MARLEQLAHGRREDEPVFLPPVASGEPFPALVFEVLPEDLAAITLQPEELKGFAPLSPEQITERTIPRLARRILAAAEARIGSAPVYFEHGQRPENRAA
ncbi:hypothetical protein ACFSL4_36630 [Streptomyces caeni]|uniref:Uncharacterized protein n=1 Tax=Streptomyces caeni TaxID=2307231 RepID=A0ABW4J1N6_9ACTN